MVRKGYTQLNKEQARNHFKRDQARQKSQRKRHLLQLGILITHDQTLSRMRHILERNGVSRVAMSIHHTVIMAGFIGQTALVSFFNERLGKSKEHFINRGEVICTILLCMASGQYKSILGMLEQIKQIPVRDMLGLAPNINADDFNHDLVTDALEAIFEYGHEKLFRELAAYAIPKMLGNDFAPKSAVLDTSTIPAYHHVGETESAAVPAGVADEIGADENLASAQTEQEQNATANTPATIKRGHSKNRRTDLGQLIIAAVVDSMFGLPLLFTVKDGDASDKTTFAVIAGAMVKALKETFSSLQYITGDSALCTKASFDALHKNGMYCLTRVPDGYTQASDLIKNRYELGDKLQPIDYQDHDGDSYLGFLTDGVMYGYKVRLLLVDNPNLSKPKEATIRRRARKEKEALLKSLKEKFKCGPDAKEHVLKLQAKNKYCSVTPYLDEEANDGSWLFDCKSVYKRRGRPSQDAKKDIRWIRVSCSVEIDEVKIQAAIERERCYVLVCTNLDPELTAANILGLYKGNQMIEAMWSLFKNRRMSINSINIHRPDRIEGLLTLTAMTLLANKLVEIKVRKAVEEGKFVMPDQRGTGYEQKPTITRITYFMKRHALVVVEDSVTGQIRLEGINNTNLNLLVALGPAWDKFLMPETYSSLSSWNQASAADIAT